MESMQHATGNSKPRSEIARIRLFLSPLVLRLHMQSGGKCMIKGLGQRLSHYGFRLFELWDAYTTNSAYDGGRSERICHLLERWFGRLQWWGALLEGRLLYKYWDEN